MLSSRTVAAGGRDGVRDPHRIMPAFARPAMQAAPPSSGFGFWIIKLRVSGPEARRAEVEAVMSALLADLRFEGVGPRAAEPLDVSDCASRSDRAARGAAACSRGYV